MARPRPHTSPQTWPTQAAGSVTPTGSLALGTEAVSPRAGKACHSRAGCVSMAPSISSTVSQSGSQRCCTAPVSTEQWEGRGLVRKAEEATQESARIEEELQERRRRLAGRRQDIDRLIVQTVEEAVGKLVSQQEATEALLGESLQEIHKLEGGRMETCATLTEWRQHKHVVETHIRRVVSSGDSMDAEDKEDHSRLERHERSLENRVHAIEQDLLKAYSKKEKAASDMAQWRQLMAIHQVLLKSRGHGVSR
mmetsp:Transcript_2218/g.4718  ORF Transcript_2218/g.4718 Transcript_2218/m.4718 type:complete len:252 (+) Transcript_2218:37-792(+)